MENKDPLHHFSFEQIVKVSHDFYFLLVLLFAEICIHIVNKKVILANKKLLFILYLLHFSMFFFCLRQ